MACPSAAEEQKEASAALTTAPHPDTEAPGNLLAPEPTVRSG